ncbi:M23 family metallopeptidase [Hassallia byssoidea VB512170]|uniref:M23 family metallopeptidase n=1 Tax=Hassallia byssoidea VB512170 TaxID=1304833 RepID=A0A846HG36_9CYAN|nr:M23 family metallopeptidase [Hassalia byssoidea]NEU75779.1 M23 family metallopeptidase [Hassalia byssoidea VB512170]
MTQRNQLGDRRLHKLLQRCLVTKRLASSLPAQSLCWLSSFSLLSGGFVYAQVDTSIDNIVPTVENSRQAVTNPVKKEVVRSRSASATESTQATPDFSERRARLKKRLRNKTEVSQSSEPVRRSTRQSESDEPVTRIRRSRASVDSEPDTTARRFRRQVEASRVKPARIRHTKPQVEDSSVTSSNSRTIERPSEVSRPPSISDSKKDYNNAYIDPNDYKNDGTSNYQAPNSVVLTERSNGCRTILAQGAGGICAKIPITPYGNQRVADSNNDVTRKQAPSWIRRSQETTAYANVSPPRRLASTLSRSAWRSTRVGPINLNNGSWREKPVASVGVSKSSFRPNRFIPKPSNFNSNPIVGSSAIAPAPGELSAPMTADNTAPRDSTVTYDIPLASVLPQIPYTGAVAVNPGGMMFPLSVPSPITSLFGWRVHPITGDRRFHAGTDLGAAMGTPILAAATGQVEVADWVGGYGLTVILNHSSAQQTLYGHMSEIFVQPGQVVQQGSVIGRVGSTGNSTGPHLHFEVRHLTSLGWVATDPGVQLDSGLSQLIQATQTARIIGQPGS